MNVKKDFPIFKNNPKLVYLDNSATTQKPQVVIDTVTNFYTKYNSSVHRGIYDLSLKATEIYEGTREKVAKFINAKSPNEIIFTGNTTESLNLVALGFAKKILKNGDFIVLSEMEHHSNIVPWQVIAKETKARIYYLPITNDYLLDYKKILSAKLNLKKVKIISLTQASNVLGTVNPLEQIIPFLKAKCSNAKFIIDAAQSIPHIKVDVKKLGCDFLAFSSHKMYGPSGVGVLFVRAEIIDQVDPLFTGGGMIETVTKKSATFAPSPEKFEAGTGKLETVAGLGAAIDYVSSVGSENIIKYEKELTKYCLQLFKKAKDIKLYGSQNSKNRLPVFAFNLSNIHPHDVGEILNRVQICVRTGHHCAQVLHQILKAPSTVRASFSIYNTKQDADKLFKELEKVRKIFRV